LRKRIFASLGSIEGEEESEGEDEEEDEGDDEREGCSMGIF